MRNLAKKINIELSKLKKDRQRFQQGDLELKEAVTNISHDLRTPLTAVCGYLDLLEKKNVPPTLRAISELYGTARKRSLSSPKSCSDIPSSPRYQTELPRSGHIKSASGRKHIAYYAILKQNHISPRISLPDTKVSRMLNRSACSRIFGNLISNAIKYSDGDLEITLRESGEIIFSNHASHLDEVQAGRLFDRFYTVETASADSTGLGLSIARALTEQMGGKIDAAYKNGILYVRVIFDFA